jgi:dihydrofolate reductase
MKISIIVAVSENNVIGVSNQLPWHLSNDLKYFKSITQGHSIIMGRKTYDSIGRPLPNRENIIITSSKAIFDSALIIKNSIDDAINYCKEKNLDEVFIIGGDTIYKQTIDIAHKIYYTKVHTVIENGNAFFPILEKEKWKLMTSLPLQLKDEKNEYNHTFETYERIV